MSRSHHSTNPADPWDALLAAAAVAYILGFVAAVEAALAKLLY